LSLPPHNLRTFELSTHVKVISRSKGHSATAAAAYRAGVCITCERTGKKHDYSRRKGVVSVSIVFPEGNPVFSRQRLWGACEARENRKNSRTAREWMFSLPFELSPAGRQRAVRRVARHLAARHGVAVDCAIHAPPEGGDPRNHHAHLLMTTRRMEGGNLKSKTRELDDKATGAQIVKEWRNLTAEILNREIALEQEQQAVHVEHRSFADRGIDQEPTKHRGQGKRSRHGKLKAAFMRVAKFTKCALIQTKVCVRSALQI